MAAPAVPGLAPLLVFLLLGLASAAQAYESMGPGLCRGFPSQVPHTNHTGVHRVEDCEALCRADPACARFAVLAEGCVAYADGARTSCALEPSRDGSFAWTYVLSDPSTLPPSIVEMKHDAQELAYVLVPILGVLLCCCLCACGGGGEEDAHASSGSLMRDAFTSPKTLVNGAAHVVNASTRRFRPNMEGPRVPPTTEEEEEVPEAVPVYASLENQSFVDVLEPETAAMQAVLRSDGDALRVALARCRRPPQEIVFWRGMNLMHVAVLAEASPQLMVMTLLQDHHMDVNAPNENGTTPLMLAAMTNNIELIRFLVDTCGANLHAKDNRGRNVLQRGECSFETKAELKFLGTKRMNPLVFIGNAFQPSKLHSRTRASIPRPGCRKGCSQSPQRAGFLMTILLYVWAGLMLGCYVPVKNASSNSTLLDVASDMGDFSTFCWKIGPSPWNYWGFVVLGVIYFLYLVEGLCTTKSLQYLRRIETAEKSFVMFCAEISKPPQLFMRLECFHYETHGSGDDRRTVKVVTYQAEQAWVYDEYWDTQSPLPMFEGTAKLKIRHAWGFGNDATLRAYLEEKDAFVLLHTRDSHQAFSTRFELPDKARSHLAVDKFNTPTRVSYRAYKLATWLFCSLWYRLILNARTPKVEMVATKVLARRTDGPSGARRPLGSANVLLGDGPMPIGPNTVTTTTTTTTTTTFVNGRNVSHHETTQTPPRYAFPEGSVPVAKAVEAVEVV